MLSFGAFDWETTDAETVGESLLAVDPSRRSRRVRRLSASALRPGNGDDVDVPGTPVAPDGGDTGLPVGPRERSLCVSQREPDSS